MAKFCTTIFAFVIVSILSVSSAYSTDLTPKSINTDPSIIFELDPVSLSVKVANINKLDASNVSIRLRIFSGTDSTGTLSFDKKLSGLSIPKYSEKDFEFPDVWIALFPTEYYAVVEVFFADDIDPSNNKLTRVLHVGKPPIPQKTAIELLIENLKAYFPKRDTARETLAVLPTPLPAGTTIKSYDPNELSVTLTQQSWLGWYRNDKFSRYTSVNGVFLLNAKDSAITYYPTKYWVNINDTAIGDRIVDSNYAVGKPPVVMALDTTTIHSTASSSSDERECAILISGRSSDSREQWAFNSDLDIVSANLRLETLGPRLQSKDIYILYRPSPADIDKLFDSLRGKCKKLWFFYSGHGDSTMSSNGKDAFGWIVTRDSSYAYWKLIDRLFTSGAEETTVLIDACHSGVAIEEIRKDERTKDHNINLITACRTGETSTTFFIGQDYMTGFGAFTLYWFKCFGDANAEYDGVPGISEQEATDWLRIQNPELPNEQHLLDLFHPSWYFHRVGQELPKDVPVDLPQTSVTVTLREGPPSTPLSVSVTTPELAYIDAPKKNLDDSSIVHLSYGRLWEFNYKPSVGLQYSIDVDFKIVPGIDSFKTGGTPGILHREDSSKPWSVYTPYQSSVGSGMIRANGVSAFSQWLMASVSKPQGAVSASNNSIASTVTVYPNPSTAPTTIQMNLEQTEDIELVINDITGKRYCTVASGLFPAGGYQIPMVRSISAGWYILELRTSKGATLASNKFIVQ